MRGSVERYGRGWRYRTELPRDAATGRRRFATKAGFATQGEARKALNQVLVDLESGSYVDRSTVTVREYLEEWLHRAAVGRRPTTMAAYRRGAVQLDPYVGRVRLQQLTPLMVENAYADLLATGLAPKTVRNAHTVLRRALGDAERLGLVTRNAAAVARPPAPSKAEQPTWAPEQLSTFLRFTAGEPLHAAFVLLSTTGLRRGEVCGLGWANVDLETGELFVTQTRTTVGSDVIDSPTKTPKSRRRVSLDGGTVVVLRSHRARQAEMQLAAGPGWVGEGHVLCEDDGAPVHPDRITGAFRRQREAAGLPPIRLHDLRHTYATLGLRAGVHPKVMSERLGHATVGITLDLYSHVVPSLDREAADAVASLLDFDDPSSGAGTESI